MELKWAAHVCEQKSEHLQEIMVLFILLLVIGTGFLGATVPKAI